MSEELRAREERTVKGLLLQMKLDENYEMRVVAEEEILSMFTDLQAKYDKALAALRGISTGINTLEWEEDPIHEKLYKPITTSNNFEEVHRAYSNFARQTLKELEGENG